MEYSLRKFEAEIDMGSYIRDYVDVDRFLACCKACPNYKAIWSCPTYGFDPLDVWRSYSRLKVIGCRLTFGEDRNETGMIEAEREVKHMLGEELIAMEKQNPGSMGLSAGACDICEHCARADDEPCRHPDRLRYSIESIGGNVSKTMEALCGIEIEWIENGRLPEHFVLVGGLMIP